MGGYMTVTNPEPRTTNNIADIVNNHRAKLDVDNNIERDWKSFMNLKSLMTYYKKKYHHQKKNLPSMKGHKRETKLYFSMIFFKNPYDELPFQVKYLIDVHSDNKKLGLLTDNLLNELETEFIRLKETFTKE
jgi:hypothetical protein